MEQLFPGFLADAVMYESAVEYWRCLADDAGTGLPYADAWELEPPQLGGDGMTILDPPGDPIRAAKCLDLGRGYRISQYEAMGPEWDPRDVPIVGWVKESGIDVLWLGLVLREDTAQLAAGALRRWMNPSTNIDEMQAILRGSYNGPG